MPLWMRVDVHYFNHPKVIQLPIPAQLLYLRAVGYSKLHLTDGLLATPAIRSIACDLAASIPGADVFHTINGWVDQMVAAGLFERTETGIAIHDFLEWNQSKQEVEFINELRGKSGAKGGQEKERRRQNASKPSSKTLANDVANDVANDKQNASKPSSKTLPIVHSTEYIEHREEEERDAPTVEKPRRTTISDPEWIEELKKNPIYSHVDFAVEFGKMEIWKTIQKNKNRKITRRFIVNWLNRIDRPIQLSSKPVKKELKVAL